MSPRTWNRFAVRRAMGGRWRYYAPFAESEQWLRITHGNRGEVVPVVLTVGAGPFLGFVTPDDGELTMVEFGWTRFNQQFPMGATAWAAMTGGEVVRLVVSEA